LPSIAFEVLFILLLILLNSFFAMAATALVSSRRTRFLSTVQAGITLMGIVLGTGPGTGIARSCGVRGGKKWTRNREAIVRNRPR